MSSYVINQHSTGINNQLMTKMAKITDIVECYPLWMAEYTA
jgi:hypothetical protein